MDRQHPTQLAAAVYRVTELFPRNEPLRYKTREIADEILADFVLFQDLEKQNAETEQGFLRRNRAKNQIFSKIKILNNYYFDLAREQGWVHPLNFLILKREYDKMKKDIEIQLSQIELPALAPEELRRAKPETEETPSISSLRGVQQNDAAISPEQQKIEPIKPEPAIESEIPTISDKTSAINVQQDELREVLENADVFLKQDFEKNEPEQPDEQIERAKGFDEAKPELEPKPARAPEIKRDKLSARHKEILKIIEQGGKKQVGDIRKSFPSLSKRTLRRDLEFLLKQEYVDRVGQWNEVSYRIKT